MHHMAYEDDTSMSVVYGPNFVVISVCTEASGSVRKGLRAPQRRPEEHNKFM